MRNAIVLATAVLAACGTAQQQSAGQPVAPDVYAGFTAGTTRFDCFVACSAAWGYNRARLRKLFEAGLWRDLGHEVLRIGLDNDLSYFYLARAAEGEGHRAAAERYYRLALAAVYTCAPLNCDGIDVPLEAKAGIGRVAAAGGA